MLSFGFTNTTATTNTSALSFGGITTPAPKKTINVESNSAVTPGGIGPGANQTQQHFAVPKPQVASTSSISVAVVKSPAPQIAATPSTNVPFAKAKVAVFNNNQRKRPSSSSSSSTSSTSGSTNSGILKSRSSFMNNNGNHGSNGSSDKRRRTTTSVLNKKLNPNAVEPSQHSSLLTNVSRRKRAPPAAPAPAFITNPNPSNRRRLDINSAFTSSSSSSTSSSSKRRSNFTSNGAGSGRDARMKVSVSNIPGNTWDQTLRDLELTGVRMSDGSRVQIENILSTLTISTAGSDDQIALDKVASSLANDLSICVPKWNSELDDAQNEALNLQVYIAHMMGTILMDIEPDTMDDVALLDYEIDYQIEDAFENLNEGQAMLNEKNIVDTEEDASMEVIEENEENEGGAVDGVDGVDAVDEDNGENGATNHLNIPSTFELTNVLVVQPSTLQTKNEKEKSATCTGAAVDV